MVWSPDLVAFRAGRLQGGYDDYWNPGNLGLGSAAFGLNTRATGQGSFAAGEGASATNSGAIALGHYTQATAGSSFAIGSNSVASGEGSIAIGISNTASGGSSTAIGISSTASGPASVALGGNASASADGAVAMGYQSDASAVDAVAIGAGSVANGDSSVAIGFASTAGRRGAIVIADRSGGRAAAGADNQFVVRAAGGIYLYSNNNSSAGAFLPAGSGTWTSLSDRNRKQDFRALDGDFVLSRIRTMPIEEWSYISEGNQVRHVGPTAQDFRAAFGLGVDDLGISTVDIDGINLFAIQQLIERYETLKTEHDALRNEVNDLRARLERLERLERLLSERDR
ncbi:MAG TPA: tail fiber domain-containing protein [Gemmatimonadaceae bacterium]|nr:tail fiber domain-containing protein [Gemmatimonadaceae bacterium]